MADVFQESYAAAYDIFYAEKDYAAECDAIIRLIDKFGEGAAKTVLDLGCGTGRHAIIMAQRGFSVTGVDRSKPMVMRAIERAKQQRLDSHLQFLCDDIRTFSCARRFDAALMNFNVLGYMTTNDDALRALRAARENVREGGVIVADFWYGPAIVADPPGQNSRTFDADGIRFIRTSVGRHLPDEQCCEIHLNVNRSENGSVIEETSEIHRVRYFFPLELDVLLRSSGFQLLALTGFPIIENRASSQRWNAALVARSI